MARQAKLANVTMDQLKAELARRQTNLPKLLKKRTKLAKELAALDKQIAACSGEAAPNGAITRRRVSTKPPREGSLRAVLVKVLSGKKGLSIAEAVQAVSDSGYKSQSKDFRLLVNQTLLNDPLFIKVARGVFAVKGQPVAEEPAKKVVKKSAKKKVGKKAKKAAGKPAEAVEKKA